jgi:TonB-linked SusC/RagA family outer membrane protein
MNRWMRDVGSALALVVGLTSSAHAQQQQPSGIGGVITGRVVHAVTQKPVVAGQVYLVGAQVGAITNAQGQFTIPWGVSTGVQPGMRTLRFQSVGYGTIDKVVNLEPSGALSVDFQVREEAIAIDKVVVTALGIERAEKSLGYAVQSIRAPALARSPEVTFLGAIAGQTAGTVITQSTGQPGGSARLTIRGEGSFRGDGQPLYVIDGVPMSVDIDKFWLVAGSCTISTSGTVTASCAVDNPLLRGQAGSRAMDIDPNNIEEISILRGAAATALYGSRAALGAVIIKTKQGTPGAPMRFSLTSRFGHEEPVIEGLQTSWAAGVGGFYCNGKPVATGGWCQPGSPTTDPTVSLAWGPHRDSIPAAVTQHEGQIQFRDPRDGFYRNGLTSTHSLYATGSQPMGTYGIGFSYTNQEGVFEKSRLDRMNLNANLSMSLSRIFRSHSVVMYAGSNNDYGWEGIEGYTALVSTLPPTRDLSVATNEDGSPVMYGTNSPHPLWLAQNEYNTTSTARWIASQRFSVVLGKGFTISDQVGLDSYIDSRQEFMNERPWLTTAGIANGGTNQRKITRRTVNNELTLTADRRSISAGNFSVSGLFGLNVFSTKVGDVGGAGRNLGIPGYYSIGNFSVRLPSANLDAYRRLVGMYSQATFDYKDWAFLTLTGRNEWSSTLPEDANSYFYPSASLSVVFTDALGWSSSLIDYGKLRLSLTKVGVDAPPFRLTSSYELGGFQDFASGTTTFTNLGFPFRTVRGFEVDDNFGNPNIRPEQTVEAEVGLETRLLNSRARADISVYSRKSTDQVFSVPVPSSTGFEFITENSGDLRNRGVEITVAATPVRSDRFGMDAMVNVTRNWSKVEDIFEGVSLYLAGGATTSVRLIEDREYGTIVGTRYQRNANGQRIIGADGFPLVESGAHEIGSIAPSWLANLSTQLRYRSVGVSALIDSRRGGQVLNWDLRATIPAGTAKVTESRNDSFTFDGVTASGAQNTQSVIRNQAFWSRYAQVDENLLESANAVRLREVSVSVDVPQRFSRMLDVQGVTLFASGRNLKTWSDFSYGDPDGNNYGSVNAGGVGFRVFTVPTTRTYSLGVRASF